MNTLTTIGLGAAAFVATNGDNLVVLLAFLADPSYKPRQVLVGYALAMAGLLALAGVGAAVGHLIPVEYLGVLGVVPLALGLKKLVELLRRGGPAGAVPPAASGRSNTLTVALFELAGGSDTVAVLAPLLAESRAWAVTVLCGTYVALTAVWCGAALYIWRHPTLGDYIRRYARYAVPFLMIGLGVYILYDTATDLFGDDEEEAG